MLNKELLNDMNQQIHAIIMSATEFRISMNVVKCVLLQDLFVDALYKF